LFVLLEEGNQGGWAKRRRTHSRAGGPGRECRDRRSTRGWGRGGTRRRRWRECNWL